MISNLWIDLRKDNWNRLEALLRQVESSGVKSLTHDELRDFGRLYRQAAADLSSARADKTSRALEQYLNKLVGRAHNYVYSGQRVTLVGMWKFLLHGYPRVVRRLSGYVWAAIIITLATAALGAVVTIVRPDFGVEFFGAQRITDLDKGKMWTDEVLEAQAPYSSAIMTNNIKVCFMAFALGITAGIGTLYVLFTNGLMLGIVGVIGAQHHMSMGVWSFIAAHGALELPSIMFAGAAGLRLGTGILFPGLLRRRDSVAKAGVEAVQLVSGCVPLLIVAGLFEAFLSPLHIKPEIKFAVGAMLFLTMCFWLMEGGRGAVESVDEPVMVGA